MCGISGYYGLDPNEALLKSMNKAQAHRGPDGEGYYTDGLVGLGHLRLSIIDKAGGAQPMFNDDHSLVIAYNGEVYNYQALRKALEAEGCTFKTHSDTEVILRGYEQWGMDVFDRLDGMFAIAIHDKKAERLVLARDQFGIKPLYYWVNQERGDKTTLLFASEIKAILASRKVKAQPNEAVLYRYLQFRAHDNSRETFFDGIYHLESGHALIIDAKGVKDVLYTSMYKTLQRSIKEKGRPYSSDVKDEYWSKLRSSVRLRLQSDVPVGTSLSGGIDSSVVAATVNELLADSSEHQLTRSVGARQNTFSAVFPGSQNDEERYVDAVAASLDSGVKVHKIKPTADVFYEDLFDFVRSQEEPTISAGPYAQYAVMKEAHKHVKVLLDGQGADEMMAGYVPYYFVYFKQLLKQKKYGRLSVEVLSSLDILFRLVRYKVLSKVTFKKKVAVGSLLDDAFTQKHKSGRLKVTTDNLKQRLYEDLFSNSIPSLLRYEDKNTMRFSIEGRVPFLDRESVEYLFSLDEEAIIKGGWNKRILRDAAKEILPPAVLKRRNKIGFTAPESEWFTRLKGRFYAIFASEEFANRPYFNASNVIEAFEGYIKGTNDTNTLVFWRLLNVELWLREFIDEKQETPAKSIKADFDPNEGKKLDITVDTSVYRRYPIRTQKINAEDPVTDTISGYVKDFFLKLSKAGREHKAATKGKWYVFVSEKIVAIMQGRSYFIWDIKPSFWARFLSKMVVRTPYGIGLGSPWTMQLAIQEAGLLRILFASIAGAFGKVFGVRGVFYNVVGDNVRAIDGPTEYSVYPSNVSAKLPPAQPNKVAGELNDAIRRSVPKEYAANFGGVVIIDANDIGRNILGNGTEEAPELLEAIFQDNPLGQADEQTPISLVFKK